jgi:hypothetical protein
MKRLLTVISLIIISVTITIPTSAGKVFAESASNSTENSLEENEVQLNEIKDEPESVISHQKIGFLSGFFNIYTSWFINRL